jgi:hypothetical protein
MNQKDVTPNMRKQNSCELKYSDISQDTSTQFSFNLKLSSTLIHINPVRVFRIVRRKSDKKNIRSESVFSDKIIRQIRKKLQREAF